MSDDTYGKSARGEEGHKARMAHVERLRASSVADDDRLVDVGLSISHPGTVPFDFTAKDLRYAGEHDMLCCSHSAAMKTSNLRHGIIERADHDVMYPGHVYIHCTDLSDSELDLVAKTGGKISIAPETEMQMGMGMPPLRACLDHDIPISLSLDTSSAAAPELLSQARLALQLQRCLDNEASHDQRKMPLAVSLTVRDALTWVTRNGADALGLGDLVGTLTPGKRADMVFISSRRFLTPSSNPLGTTVLWSTGQDVDTVMVDGRLRKRHGQLLGHDVDLIRSKTEAAVQRINEKLAKMPPDMEKGDLKEFLMASERSTRTNLGKAYVSEVATGDWLRSS